MIPELAGVAEVARILGVSRQRVNELMKIDVRFPACIASLACGRIWLVSDIKTYAAIPRPPGRPRLRP